MSGNQPVADHDPNVSPYLRRPLRTYEEALRDLQRAKPNRDRREKNPGQSQTANPACDANPHDGQE